jgi:hypothetical protein
MSGCTLEDVRHPTLNGSDPVPKYESSRRPEIAADDLANVTMLLGCFDKITFNSYGELVALLTVDLPVIGPVLISLYDRESHLQVYRGKEADYDASMWTGNVRDIYDDFEYKYDRDLLIMYVKNVLRNEIAKQLV